MNTEAVYSEHGVTDAAVDLSNHDSAGSKLRRILRRIVKPMVRAHWERQAIRELSGMPPYLLRDIGLRHEEIHGVAADLARERADAWARQAQASNGFGG